MKIVDVRYKIKTNGKYGARSLASINGITIHHSADEDGDSASYAIYHVNHNGWAGIGYHYVVLKNGTIEYCGSENTIRAHNPSTNATHIGICLVGNMSNHEPTTAQINAVKEFLQHLFTKRPDLPNLTGFHQVVGHKDTGRQTACPGATWKQWKPKIKPGSVPSQGGSSGGSDSGSNDKPISNKGKRMGIIIWDGEKDVYTVEQGANKIRHIKEPEFSKVGYNMGRDLVVLGKMYKFKDENAIYYAGGKKFSNPAEMEKKYPGQGQAVVTVDPSPIKAPLERKISDISNERDQIRGERDVLKTKKESLEKDYSFLQQKEIAHKKEIEDLKKKLNGTTKIDPDVVEKAGWVDSLKALLSNLFSK